MGLDDQKISPTSSSDHGSPDKAVGIKSQSEDSDEEEQEISELSSMTIFI